MKNYSLKKNSYIILLVILAALIFSMSAICNFCQFQKPGQKTDTQSQDLIRQEKDNVKEEGSTSGKTSSSTQKPAQQDGQKKETNESQEQQNSPEVNRNPVLNEIILSDNNPVTQWDYSIFANATDPDGDSLEYSWAVTGGSIVNRMENPAIWITPNAAGSYIVKVVVTDGKGGRAEKEITVNVAERPPEQAEGEAIIVVDEKPPPADPEGDTYDSIEMLTKIFPVNREYTGYVVWGESANFPACVFIGDSAKNNPASGYVLFDIPDLSGKKIHFVRLSFSLKQKFGDPSFFDYRVLLIKRPDNIILGEVFSSEQVLLKQIPGYRSGTFSIESSALRQQIQEAIDGGKKEIWICLDPSPFRSDNNNSWDGWEYDQSGIRLEVIYSD